MHWLSRTRNEEFITSDILVKSVTFCLEAEVGSMVDSVKDNTDHGNVGGLIPQKCC